MTTQADSTSETIERLAAYIATAGRRRLPAAVQEKTKHHVLDTLAAMISGSKLLPGLVQNHAVALCTVIDHQGTGNHTAQYAKT